MPFTIEKLPDAPIVVCTLQPPFDASKELMAFFTRIAEVMDGLEGPIYRILDVRPVDLSFSEMMLAIAEETRSGRPGTLADPRVRSVVVVTLGTMAEFGAASTEQAQYGAVPSHIVTDMDAALDYARAQLVV